MAELIAIFIFVCSLLGMVVIIWRKIPVLAGLPEVFVQTEKEKFSLKEKIKKINPFKSSFFEVFFQKVLSKIRILTLKVENKTDKYLQRLREKAQKKKKLEKDNYWQELKNSTNEKDKNLPPG